MNFLQPEQLTVLTTSKCTARCEHCSMNSGPERKEELDFNNIKHLIDELNGHQKLKVIIFAGGEPTLLGEDLLEAIAYANMCGINTRLVTNAYWATSIERAQRKLVELREAGLSELNISVDDQHTPYIPVQRSINAWKAAKGLGFSAVIIANCYGPNSTLTPSRIMELLGEELVERFDEDGCSQTLGEPASDGTYYAMSNAYLQRLGRAHGCISESDLFYPKDQAELDCRCPWAVKSAAISPNNHLVACCGMEAEGNVILDFGSLQTNDPQTLINKANNNLIVNTIALKGPFFLKNFIQRYAPGIPFRDKYASVCEICEHIVTREEAIDVLNQNSVSLAVEMLSIKTT